MVELVDTHVSGTCASRRGGSTPPLGRLIWTELLQIELVDTSRPVGMLHGMGAPIRFAIEGKFDSPFGQENETVIHKELDSTSCE